MATCSTAWADKEGRVCERLTGVLTPQQFQMGSSFRSTRECATEVGVQRRAKPLTTVSGHLLGTSRITVAGRCQHVTRSAYLAGGTYYLLPSFHNFTHSEAAPHGRRAASGSSQGYSDTWGAKTTSIATYSTTSKCVFFAVQVAGPNYRPCS